MIAQASTAQQTGTLIGPSVTQDLTYTTPVYTTGDLNVGSGDTSAVCNFQNLWVGGNLTISNDATFTCQNLHVVGNLTIVRTGNTMDLGNAYVGGDVDFGSGGRQVIAPVLVVGGSVSVTTGNIIGSSTTPCMLLMSNSTNTAETFLANGGTSFTGVVANLTGGTTTLDNGDRYVESIFSAGTVTMLGDAQVTFDGSAVGTWTTQSTRVVQPVAGTWQHLSPSDT